jgi:hypothetical protein
MKPPLTGIFDEPLGCLRINEAWYSYVSGLLRRAEIDYFWDEDEQDGKDAVSELINSFDTVPCEGESTVHNDYAAIGYVVEADEGGSAVSDLTWTQVPFNLVMVQDGVYPQLQVDGTVILPAGSYAMRAWCTYQRQVNGRTPLGLRVTDGVAVDQVSGYQSVYWSGQVLLDYVVSSDGSTPIQLRVWSPVSGRFGHTYPLGLPGILAYAEFRDYKEA